jgi:non-ribosomal peptide synthetase-like protein
LPAGTERPDDVLLGVCTVADATSMRAGTDWFGHPPLSLPRREIAAADRSVTHEPTAVRRVTRIVWESLRFTLPLTHALVLMVWWTGIAGAAAGVGPVTAACVVAPLALAAVAAALCVFVLVLKWALLGRVRRGEHPLWSCWCSRWDFHFLAWQVCARPFLVRLEGTLLLSAYLRGMGATIGRRVVLGDGFAHVVDPDMLHFDDGATVAGLFQAHSFEDRVLKIDHVHVGRGATLGSGAVLFYGADVGAGARVAPHSVVMKHERLSEGHAYVGSPIVAARAS